MFKKSRAGRRKTKKSLKFKLISVLVIGLVIGGLVYWFFVKNNNSSPADRVVYRSQLTGLEVSQEDSERPVLAVIIENTPEARPQTGLANAGIVFETVAEGGITRYLAMYQEDMPTNTGPIRSLRTFFLDWTMGFDAPVGHVGGSSDALQLARERSAKSLNQFNYPGAYKRVDYRSAPHNVYANMPELRNLQKEQGYTSSQFDSIPRTDDDPAEEAQSPIIKINFSSPIYNVEYRYQPQTNDYVRLLGGQEHKDEQTNNTITVKNIVVMTGFSGPQGIGQGKAIIFKDGKSTVGSWQQKNFNERVQILDDQGNQIGLNRGNTWFAALPAERQVRY
jgi:hypothetical protein